MIKVALVGNVANNFFREAALLACSSWAHVACYTQLGPNTVVTEQINSDPVSKDLEDGTVVRNHKPLAGASVVSLLLPDFIFWGLIGRKSESLRAIRNSDIAVVSGGEIMLAPKMGCPFVIRTTGSDLTVFPSLKFREFWKLRGAKKPKTSDRVIFYIQKWLYRRAYRKACAISVARETPYLRALASFNFGGSSKILRSIPLGIDTSSFAWTAEQSKLLPEKVHDQDFVVFMPSRAMMKDDAVFIRTGQWKASDNAVRGFKLFHDRLDSEDRKKIWLVIPKRTLSDDLALLRDLVDQLQLSNRVIWVEGMNSEGLSRIEMIPLFSRASVTLDDFGVGWYGSVFVEAAACSSPIITYLTPTVLEDNGFPSAMVAQSPNDIASGMYKLWMDPELGRSMGSELRRWVIERHTEKAVESAYRRIVSKVLPQRMTPETNQQRP